MVQASGKVYLVGAGPGDDGLVTVRGLECIKIADVIAHDRLAGRGSLDHRKPNCQCSYVGKSSSRHALSQDAINQLLVRLASEGKCVVRLKGGDVFLFGRGGATIAGAGSGCVPRPRYGAHLQAANRPGPRHPGQRLYDARINSGHGP